MPKPTTPLSPEDAIAEVLRKFPNVREIPVRNVAHWSRENLLHNSLNLAADARAYGWKGDQLKAITLVLKLQHKL